MAFATDTPRRLAHFYSSERATLSTLGRPQIAAALVWALAVVVAEPVAATVVVLALAGALAVAAALVWALAVAAALVWTHAVDVAEPVAAVVE